MANRKKNRVGGHLPAEGESYATTHYRVRPLPSKAPQSGELTGFAQVVPEGSMSLEDLLERMERENPGMKPSHTRMVVEVLLNSIVTALREGRRVTIGNFLTFGTSIKGRVNPDKPEVAGKLELHPWVRCSQVMIDDLNKGAKFTRLSR